MITSRRSFLGGLGALLIAAPAIVRAASIMSVKAMPATEVLDALLEQPFSLMPASITFVPPTTGWSGEVIWMGKEYIYRNGIIIGGEEPCGA